MSSIILLVVLRKKLQSIFVGKSDNNSSDDIDGFIGKKVKVIESISPNETGKVVLNGTNWNAESDEEIKKIPWSKSLQKTI